MFDGKEPQDVRQFIELLESGLELNSNGQKLDDAFPRTLFIATFVYHQLFFSPNA